MKRQTVLASIAILFILALTVSQVFAAGPAWGSRRKTKRRRTWSRSD